MGFRIKNKEGETLKLNALDQEAATLWGVELRKESYASPYKPDGTFKTESLIASTNWFDNIGFIIHKLKTSDWEEVKADYLRVYLEALKEYEGTEDYEKAKEVLLGRHVKAMCDLIDYWKEKGYQPVYVND